MSQQENTRINVSVDQLRAELATLELRLVDRLTKEISSKADNAEFRQLRHRVSAVEAQRPLGDRLVVEFLEFQKDVSSLKLWRSYSAGALAGMTAVITLLGSRVFFGL